jgi:hypothetical protein
MGKIPQSEVELNQALNEQLHLLQLDCASYDSGIEIAAKSMAAKMRILLHDGKNPRSRSLLRQTSKHQTLFLDTAFRNDPGNLLTYSGLLRVSLRSNGAKYEPHLGHMPHAPQMVAFDQWWNSTVFEDSRKNLFTRRDLVMTLADQDGGAHVDPSLDQKYHELTRQNSLGWQSSSGDGTWTALTNPHYAAVRQISHEILTTLVPQHQHNTQGHAQEPAGLSIMGMQLSVGSPSAKQGRNERCGCGSGLKFKRCHGR